MQCILIGDGESNFELGPGKNQRISQVTEILRANNILSQHIGLEIIMAHSFMASP